MSIYLRLCLRSNQSSMGLSCSKSRVSLGLGRLALIRQRQLKTSTLVCITLWTCSSASASLHCHDVYVGCDKYFDVELFFPSDWGEFTFTDPDWDAEGQL